MVTPAALPSSQLVFLAYQAGTFPPTVARDLCLREALALLVGDLPWRGFSWASPFSQRPQSLGTPQHLLVWSHPRGHTDGCTPLVRWKKLSKGESNSKSGAWGSDLGSATYWLCPDLG